MRHMAKHKNTISTHMTEKARQVACEKRIPMMWLNGCYALCLICGEGKTKYSADGTPEKFFQKHQQSTDCTAQFETVRNLYGFDAPTESDTTTSTSEEEAPTAPSLPAANVVVMTQGISPAEKKGVRLLTTWFGERGLGHAPFDEIATWVIEEMSRSYAKIQELETKLKWV